MNSCNARLPGGLADCMAALEAWKNMIVLDKGTQFSSKTLAGNKAAWITKLSTDLTAFVPQGFEANESTTDDPAINTAQFGQKSLTMEGVPSMVVRLSTNLCDAKEMEKQFKGGVFDVVGILEHGNLDMVADGAADGGYRARIWALRDKIVKKGEEETTFAVYIMFQDLTDWDNQDIVETVGWNPLRDLPDAMPTGLNLTETVAYSAAGGTMTVKVTERCGSIKTGLVTADFEVLASNDLTTVAITAAETPAASGTYVLTITKDPGAIDLAVGDWLQQRVNQITTGVTVAQSGSLTSYVVA